MVLNSGYLGCIRVLGFLRVVFRGVGFGNFGMFGAFRAFGFWCIYGFQVVLRVFSILGFGISKRVRKL